MVTLYDETRFQILPTDEEWELFKKSLEKRDKKIIVIDKTYWHNVLTRCKGVVTNMPIYASMDNSSRTRAILSIITYKTREDCTVDTSTEKLWIFNRDYAHTNITAEVDTEYWIDEDTRTYYKINYEMICCPVTQHHLYTYKENEIKLILTGQLQGQNGGSPFRTVQSVVNNYHDAALRDNTSGFIKRSAPIVQLLTKKSMSTLHDLANKGTLREELGTLNLPSSDSEVMVKCIYDDHYTCVSKEQAEELKDSLSLYYPTLTYEQTQALLDTLPKVQIDLACIGLGSAGTGILDQVVRGNWFEKFLLVDFDSVENKNLRNQWYKKQHIYYTKTEASRTIINEIKKCEVITKTHKFQEANLENFETKYLISGFDSIECRLELLDYVEQGKAQAKYIIDTRYDDLDASIFFIDTEDKAQMEYYRKGLESDLQAFKDKESKDKTISTEEDFMKWLNDYGIFEQGCSKLLYDITGLNDCYGFKEANDGCGGNSCLNGFKKLFAEYKDKVIKYCEEHPVAVQEESSCIKQNLIDIYKFASSFVFSAIREIEDGESKPFTHIEATTNRLPASMVLRK